MRTIWREPLLHFLLIGLGLFLLYGRAAPGDSDSRRITVSQSQVDNMVRQFQSAFKRPPTLAERRGLIDTFVRDEIVYREGLALGLDEDDAVIKRRIRQKYELIAEEGRRSAPTEAELSDFLKTHPAKFARASLIGFDQIFFDPATTSPQAVDAVKAVLVRGADPATAGQPSLLTRSVANSGIDLVARDFGDDFARRIETAPLGQWVGPVASGLGVHLVRVNRRAAPSLPPLDRVRAEVTREYESDRRTRSRDADYSAARANYDVIVEADGR